MSVEALQEQLENEVKEHNDLLEQVNKIKEQIKQGENQLFLIQGRVSVLKELIDSQSSNGVSAEEVSPTEVVE